MKGEDIGAERREEGRCRGIDIGEGRKGVKGR